MENILYFILAYVLGFWIAYAISVHYINKYRTNDNPIIGALFSWITVLIVILAEIGKGKSK